jgi:hypothetical protein
LASTHTVAGVVSTVADARWTAWSGRQEHLPAVRGTWADVLDALRNRPAANGDTGKGNTWTSNNNGRAKGNGTGGR